MPSLALARSVCARPERALTARAVTRRALCCCQARKARASRGAEEEHVNLSKTAALSQQGWLYAEQAAQHDSARQRLDLDEDSEEAAPWLDAVVKVRTMRLLEHGQSNTPKPESHAYPPSRLVLAPRALTLRDRPAIGAGDARRARLLAALAAVQADFVHQFWLCCARPAAAHQRAQRGARHAGARQAQG